MEHETQHSTSKWALETFGPAGSNSRIAARANEEMSEVLKAATSDAPSEKIIEECADVVIVLYCLVDRLGGNLVTAIDLKMAKNRNREWKQDGTGHGYHVRAS